MSRNRNREPIALGDLPADIGTERALLGALISDNRMLEHCEGIQPGHFSDATTERIFRAIVHTRQKGLVANANTIRHYCQKDTDTSFWHGGEPVSVEAFINGLGELAAERATVKSYARTLAALAKRRAMIVLAEDLAEAARNMGVEDEPETLIEGFEAKAYNIKRTGFQSRPVMSAEEAVQAALDAFEAAHVLRPRRAARHGQVRLGRQHRPQRGDARREPGPGRHLLARNVG
jgi:replicative DNA helicase